jgi:hypothetical protein
MNADGNLPFDQLVKAAECTQLLRETETILLDRPRGGAWLLQFIDAMLKDSRTGLPCPKPGKTSPRP